MKKHTEKQPIDDLFARKLGNASLTPNADAWQTLQARIGQKDKQRVTFWRNPVVYGYVAAAACLVLVALFGWLYWPASKGETELSGTQVASSKQVKPQKLPKSEEQKESNISQAPKKAIAPAINRDQRITTPEERLAKREEPIKRKALVNQPAKADKPVIKSIQMIEPVVAQNKAVETPTKPASSDVSEQPVIGTEKPAPATERVLVVTIAEPDALIAARLAAQDAEDKVTVVNAQESKKSGLSKFFNQVQRIKQGETVVARDENDRGLLNRAYKGIKHSFEKDKSDKQ